MKLGDRIGEAARRTDRMLVAQDRRRYARVLVTDLFLFLLAVAAWSGHVLASSPVLLIGGSLIVGLQLGRTGIMTIRRASSYRSGWLNGRSAMISAMTEAHARGMTVTEWLSSELARDYAVLGISPEEAERFIEEQRGDHD